LPNNATRFGFDPSRYAQSNDTDPPESKLVIVPMIVCPAFREVNPVNRTHCLALDPEATGVILEVLVVPGFAMPPVENNVPDQVITPPNAPTADNNEIVTAPPVKSVGIVNVNVPEVAVQYANVPPIPGPPPDHAYCTCPDTELPDNANAALL
jgi:hypothetical protein